MNRGDVGFMGTPPGPSAPATEGALLVTGIGRSTDIDTEEAVPQAVARAIEALGGARPSAALVFLGAEYDRALSAQLLDEALGGVPFIGCTTCGDMTGDGGHADDAVTVVAFASDTLTFRAGFGAGLSRDPAAAVDAALQMAGCEEGDRPALVLTTPDGLTSDMAAVVTLLERRSSGAPILGGTSADQRKVGPTVQLCAGRVLQDAVPVLVAWGPLRASWGLGCGWISMGPEHRVTSADGHRVHAIDGRPAIETFRTYLGAEDLGFFGEFPLAVYPEGDEAFYLRAVFGTEPDGTLVLAGSVDEGVRVRVATADRDEVVGGARGAAREAAMRYRERWGAEARPSAALAFSCAARRWILGSRAGDEVAAIAEGLRRFGMDPPNLAGFFSYGEIAPLVPGGPSYFHNTTCVVLLLGEDV